MNKFYPRTIVRKTVGAARTKLATEYLSEFQSPQDLISIEKKQLVLFNKAWAKARQIPFYSYWQREHELPNQIPNLSSLESWPKLSKDDLRENSDLVSQTPGITGAYTTSGSTGQPFSFPKGNNEQDAAYSSMWSYRTANGLSPFDPSFVVTNLYVKAAQSPLAQLKRRTARGLKDIAVNAWRTSGFIPTTAEADKALKAIRFLEPKYLIGYPSGIAQIARRAKEIGLILPSVTHVILTSETIFSRDIELIRSSLNAKVLIEYGSVETGVIAGTSPDQESWPIKVLWWHHLIRTGPDNSALATTLSDRVFPLINYSIGDLIEPGLISPSGSVLSIGNVQGRARDVLRLPTKNGEYKVVAARQVVNVVRDLEGAESIQVAQISDDLIRLFIVSRTLEVNRAIELMSSSLARNLPDLKPGSIAVSFIDSHISSARGKRGVVINPEEAPADTSSYQLI